MQASREYRHVGPRAVAAMRDGFRFASDANERADQIALLLQGTNLRALGIQGVTPRMVSGMMEGRRLMSEGFGMDADLQATVTTASITTSVQFLQNWLPGFVNIITAARKIDEMIGMTTSGAWEDEEIVQGTMEQTGTSVLYGDYTSIPLSSWNANWETRTNVRFEEGLMVGVLEEARAGRVNINSAEQKRDSAALALEINRNKVGFYGFNSGNGRTYGFLNDPNLPAASAFPNGASASPAWSTKTFAEIQKDIRLMVVALRNQSQDTIDPETTPMTLGLATNTVDYLTTTTDFGISVRDWMTKAYPKIRVVSAPELELAIMSANEAFLFAETINDTSTDNKRVFDQIIPAKMRLVGVQPGAKQYTEDYSNATAGVLLKRPFAVVRRYGN